MQFLWIDFLHMKAALYFLRSNSHLCLIDSSEDSGVKRRFKIFVLFYKEVCSLQNHSDREQKRRWEAVDQDILSDWEWKANN